MNTAENKGNKSVDPIQQIFTNAIKEILGDFSERAKEIVLSRYGIFNAKALTLEEIGKKYNITRERVRQVIREVLKKVQEKKDDQIFSKIRENVFLALQENSGIMEKEALLEKLGKGVSSEKAALNFFLECMDVVGKNEIKGELLSSFSLPDFDVEKWQVKKNIVVEILKTQKKPLLLAELFKAIKNQEKEFDLSQETLLHYLEVSAEIRKNTFGKWGIAKWKEISPKGTREKSYMVLKEASKPLHFREIAKKIDHHNLNKKKTHAQTVHNELIKDENFVLVGRGIYALVEWGYRSGTVKDVIEDILKKSEKLMNKDDVLSKVLEIRHVKKSTIVINLNNYFIKTKSGHYSVKK